MIVMYCGKKIEKIFAVRTAKYLNCVNVVVVRLFSLLFKVVSSVLTVYEYLYHTQPEVIFILRRTGLLKERPIAQAKEILSFREVVTLMQHGQWRRVRGALRQVHAAVIH
ncbi:MAG: hypothetical protein A4E56_00388 [Pelotomaculum sp. PtaU1.Bin065]|nr:MAG: hypothetical protein A4E56_00388 [Pelotomaculum sp. PtaU1.Bin065]